MNRRELVVLSLADCVSRLDVVLQPWGFAFETDDCQSSHTGPFASGHYVRQTTRIGISCRDTIDNIHYEHSFITQHPSSREIERFTIGHPGLMQSLGHTDDCHLIGSTDIPDAIVARDGGDRVTALLHDLANFVAPFLCEPTDGFCEIVRCGYRAYSIE